MAIDPEDLEQITKVIQAQIKNIKDDVLSQQQEAFKRRDSDLKNVLAEALKDVKPAAKAEAAASEAADQGQGQDDKSSNAWKVAEAKHRETLARLEDAERRREEAENQAKQDRLRMEVESAIAREFPAEVVPNVMARLTVENRLRYTDDNRAGMYFQRNGYEEVLPVDRAVKEFAESDIGKTFLPARGVNGTGDSTRIASTPVPLSQKGTVDWDALKAQVDGRFIQVKND